MRKRSSPGTRKVPPSFSRFLFFRFFPFLTPSPLHPGDTTHHSPGSNSSSQSPNTVTWLTFPPLPPSAPGTFPLGVPAPILQGGGLGVWGGVALPLPWGLALPLGLLCWAWGGGRLPRGLWAPMGPYDGLWGPMGTYGGLWGLIGAYGDLWGIWGRMGAYGGLWGPMLMIVETELAKEIQEINRASGPKPDKDKDKDKDKKGKGRWRNKEDAVNEVATLKVAGFFLGGRGEGGGWGPWGGVSSPRCWCCCCCCCYSPPPRSRNVTQPLRCESMPPALLPASHLPKPSRTERAKSGSVRIIRPNPVTPTRRVRPPPAMGIKSEVLSLIWHVVLRTHIRAHPSKSLIKVQKCSPPPPPHTHTGTWVQENGYNSADPPPQDT